MSRYQHGYPWASLTAPPSRPLLSAGPQCYIPYQYRVAVCRFELVVLPLLVHVKRSTGDVGHCWRSRDDIYIYIYSSRCLSISDCSYVCMYVCISISVCPYLSIYLSHSDSIYLSIYLRLYYVCMYLSIYLSLFIYLSIYLSIRSLSGVMANVLDCDILVSEFELQSRYYVYFRINTLGKGMSPLIFPAMGKIVSLLFIYKDSFGIKQPTNAHIPVNKERKDLSISICSYLSIYLSIYSILLINIVVALLGARNKDTRDELS